MPPNNIAAAQEHLRRNHLGPAEAEVRALLTRDPNNVQGRTLLGVIFLKSGRLSEAKLLLQATHESDPTFLEPIGLLAVIHRSENDPAGALKLFLEMVRLGHETADVTNQIGACFLAMDDAIAAANAFKRAIELDRNAAHSYFNLGIALDRAGKSYETFVTFRRSLELNPNSIETYVQIWAQMRRLLNWSEGLPLLEGGLIRHPNSTQIQVILASAYGKVGQPEKAEKLFQRAISHDPSVVPSYAHWLQEEGRFEESVPVLIQAIRQNPIQGQAYYNLTVAKRTDIDGEPLVEVLPRIENHPNLGNDERMFLHYALAKSHEQDKNFEQAIRQFDKANAIAYQLFNSKITHDEAAVDAENAILVELYSKEAIDRLAKLGSQSSTPIFIIGMIRTGTTLLDQILSSHPKVKSAGEQPFWQVSAGRANRRRLSSVGNANEIKELADAYLEILTDAVGESHRVTDKMPTNFWHVGLMSVVFPNAKFIHLRRNPLDTCLSIYTTFLGTGTQFAYSQANIVGYYRAYLRTMEHWRTVISPAQMLEIDYEDLVTNKEIVLREVLEFCGLEWDDACLNHEQNVSQVSTPSLWTARQPVNTASVERWRKYEPWLGQLLELKDLQHPAPVGRS